jgi:hypothetical protein
MIAKNNRDKAERPRSWSAVTKRTQFDESAGETTRMFEEQIFFSQGGLKSFADREKSFPIPSPNSQLSWKNSLFSLTVKFGRKRWNYGQIQLIGGLEKRRNRAFSL